MADNVLLPATGTGTASVTQATDDVSGIHYPKVKLVDGTADSSAGIPGSATDGLLVNLGTNNDVTVTGSVTANAGTNLNTSTLALETGGNLASVKTAVELIDDAIKSDDATFTVATDKVMMAGRQAVAHSANPDAADAGDAVVGIANRHRVPFMIGGHPNIVTVSASYATTQADTAIISVSAGTKIVVTSIGIYADGGGTGPLDVQVGFGASTVSSTAAIIDHPGIVKGSGVVLGNGAGIIAVGADGDDLRIDATGFGSGDELTVCVSYYTIES